MRKANGEGSIFKDKNNGLYRYYVTLGYDENGKPIRRAYSSKIKRIALEKGRAALAQANAGIVLKANATFDDAAALWMKANEASVAPSTYNNYKNMLRGTIMPFFYGRKLESIKPADVQMFLSGLKGASTSRITKSRFIVRGILETAVDNDMIPRSPFRGIKMPQAAEKVEKRAYTHDEFYTLLGYLEERNALPILTMLLTGMRAGEMCALEWKDIDIERRIIHIRHAVGRTDTETYLSRPKTDAGKRDIPMCDRLCMSISKAPQKGNFAFPNENGDMNNSFNFQRRTYTTIMKDAPVPLLNPHELRHSFNTELLRRGVPEYICKKLMGHANHEMTTGTYFHDKNMAGLAIRLLDEPDMTWGQVLQ